MKRYGFARIKLIFSRMQIWQFGLIKLDSVINNYAALTEAITVQTSCSDVFGVNLFNHKVYQKKGFITGNNMQPEQFQGIGSNKK